MTEKVIIFFDMEGPPSEYFWPTLGIKRRVEDPIIVFDSFPSPEQLYNFDTENFANEEIRLFEDDIIAPSPKRSPAPVKRPRKQDWLQGEYRRGRR